MGKSAKWKNASVNEREKMLAAKAQSKRDRAKNAAAAMAAKKARSASLPQELMAMATRTSPNNFKFFLRLMALWQKRVVIHSEKSQQTFPGKKSKATGEQRQLPGVRVRAVVEGVPPCVFCIDQTNSRITYAEKQVGDAFVTLLQQLGLPLAIAQEIRTNPARVRTEDDAALHALHVLDSVLMNPMYSVLRASTSLHPDANVTALAATMWEEMGIRKARTDDECMLIWKQTKANMRPITKLSDEMCVQSLGTRCLLLRSDALNAYSRETLAEQIRVERAREAVTFGSASQAENDDGEGEGDDGDAMELEGEEEQEEEKRGEEGEGKEEWVWYTDPQGIRSLVKKEEITAMRAAMEAAAATCSSGGGGGGGGVERDGGGSQQSAAAAAQMPARLAPPGPFPATNPFAPGPSYAGPNGPAPGFGPGGPGPAFGGPGGNFGPGGPGPCGPGPGFGPGFGPGPCGPGPGFGPDGAGPGFGGPGGPGYGPGPGLCRDGPGPCGPGFGPGPSFGPSGPGHGFGPGGPGGPPERVTYDMYGRPILSLDQAVAMSEGGGGGRGGMGVQGGGGGGGGRGGMGVQGGGGGGGGRGGMGVQGGGGGGDAYASQLERIRWEMAEIDRVQAEREEMRRTGKRPAQAGGEPVVPAKVKMLAESKALQPTLAKNGSAKPKAPGVSAEQNQLQQRLEQEQLNEEEEARWAVQIEQREMALGRANEWGQLGTQWSNLPRGMLKLIARKSSPLFRWYLRIMALWEKQLDIVPEIDKTKLKKVPVPKKPGEDATIVYSHAIKLTVRLHSNLHMLFQCHSSGHGLNHVEPQLATHLLAFLQQCGMSKQYCDEMKKEHYKNRLWDAAVLYVLRFVDDLMSYPEFCLLRNPQPGQNAAARQQAEQLKKRVEGMKLTTSKEVARIWQESQLGRRHPEKFSIAQLVACLGPLAVVVDNRALTHMTGEEVVEMCRRRGPNGEIYGGRFGAFSGEALEPGQDDGFEGISAVSRIHEHEFTLETGMDGVRYLGWKKETLLASKTRQTGSVKAAVPAVAAPTAKPVVPPPQSVVRPTSARPSGVSTVVRHESRALQKAAPTQPTVDRAGVEEEKRRVAEQQSRQTERAAQQAFAERAKEVEKELASLEPSPLSKIDVMKKSMIVLPWQGGGGAVAAGVEQEEEDDGEDEYL